MAEMRPGVMLHGVTGRMGDVAHRARETIIADVELGRFIRCFLLREPHPYGATRALDWKPERLEGYV